MPLCIIDYDGDGKTSFYLYHTCSGVENGELDDIQQIESETETSYHTDV